MPEYRLPNAEERRAGMAAFRRQMLAAHERALASGNLKPRDAEFQRDMIRTIKAAQVARGEV